MSRTLQTELRNIAPRRISQSFAEDIKRLRYRDGSDCWICGLKIDFGRDYARERKVSRDHVIPKSLGGSDELSNLRLAHRYCNQTRGGPEHSAIVPRDRLREHCRTYMKMHHADFFTDGAAQDINV